MAVEVIYESSDPTLNIKTYHNKPVIEIKLNPQELLRMESIGHMDLKKILSGQIDILNDRCFDIMKRSGLI